MTAPYLLHEERIVRMERALRLRPRPPYHIVQRRFAYWLAGIEGWTAEDDAAALDRFQRWQRARAGCAVAAAAV